MTHIEDHEPFEPAPEVTASSQQQSPPEDNGQLEDPHVTLGNQKAPCDFAPARAATSSHVTYDNPGCLQGSFDQSSHIFGENAGKQCATNGIAAIMTHTTHSVLKWKKKNIHHILKQGNGLYTSMLENKEISAAKTSGHIFISELPRHCKLNNKLFSLEYFDTLTGSLDQKHDYDASLQNIAMPLDEAIQKTLLQTDTCLLNIQGSVCAVFKVETAFAVFDPHSRSTWGSVAPDGTSIVAHYATVYELYDHIENLVNSLYQNHPHAFDIPNKVFEVTGVKAVEVNSPFTALTAQPEASTSAHDGTLDTDSDSDLCVLSVTDRNSLAVNASFSLETCVTSTCDTTVNIDSDPPIHTEGASDVCIISVTDSPNIIFTGLTLREKNRICNKLNIVPSLDQNIVAQTFDMAQPEPCQTTSIEGDGNCFFRSLSSVLSGCESNHKAFRKAVVNHVSNNPLHYITCLRREFASVEQYLQDSKMKYVGSWATELEIQVSADLLCVHIYTYSQQKWITFTANIEPIVRKAIYLKHCNECHYEPIACVKGKTSHTCFSLTSFCEMSHKMSNADLVSPSKKCTDKVKNRTKNKAYAEDTEYRQVKKLQTQQRYKCDEQYQAKLKNSSIERYANNEPFQKQVKNSSIEKYANTELFKEQVKNSSIEKYANNELFKEQVKNSSIEKYANNELFKEQVKNSSIEKYANNPAHRKQLIQSIVTKYREDPAYKPSVIERNCQKRLNLTLLKHNIDYVIELFQEGVKHGPEHVCCVCHRLLFRKQVKLCDVSSFESKASTVSAIAKQCITTKYLHQCDNACLTPCTLKQTVAGKLWICFSCNSKILSGKVPQESAVNNMALDPIPDELGTLNSLEQHLCALNIPFMRLVALPRGSQNSVHGPVTCVPSNSDVVTSVLPRLENQDLMIRIKLKRKLTYKGHYQYQYVHTQKIQNAIACLKDMNKWYKDIDFNAEWENPLPEDACSVLKECNPVNDTPSAPESSDTTTQSDQVSDDEEADHIYETQTHGLLLDTCLQPIDIAQEIFDQHFESVLSIAPAEGNSPVRLLTDKGNEAKCFPTLFPKGTGTFHDARPHRLTLSRYINTRILNADGRFSSNLDYIFYAQYLSEVNQVVSKVSIALRKGYHAGESLAITSAMLSNKDYVQNVLKTDLGYKFLQPIRGTPVFWQGVQKNLFAMVRQLGVPTWFCSFSCADLRWTELIDVFMRLQKIQGNVNDLDWSQRCNLLKTNPVTAARMFQHRFQTFLNDVIKSPANPIGKVIDTFFRVEFQQRGSPHTHCLFWVENAPKIGKNTDQEVTQFIDKYISCELPPATDALHEVVSGVQKHSSKHSKSCRKKGTTCRFNFPRPPSNHTFLCRSKTDENQEVTDADPIDVSILEMRKEKEVAKSVMTRVKHALSSPDLTFDTVDQLFASVNITQEMFENAYRLTTNKNAVVHKRNPSDVYVNQYNKDLLRCWDANMDIQYVCDAFACVVYIISYISKAEQDMGLLLQHTQNEMKKHGNLDAKQTLNKLGSVFLHNREVSAQESVYRVTNMHLNECSRLVTFIPTGENTVRMSYPLSVIQSKAEQGDTSTESIWMTSITDRYKNRPQGAIFHDICIATFVSKYRVLYGKEQHSNGSVKLENNTGFVKMRTRGSDAVARYARFSQTKYPEKHYQSLLQLFLPHYSTDELKPPPYNSYEQFYRTGSITNSSNTTQSVKEVVDLNRSLFEVDADELDRCQEVAGHHGAHDEAWADLCPESELERLECQEEMSNNNDTNQNEREAIPDLQSDTKATLSKEFPTHSIQRAEGLSIMRTLNEQQTQIFYKIRAWCLDKVNGKNPDPFRVFISGGAGTGKSHLIKAVYYESCRLFARMSINPDDTHVLLAAPTGVAAYNINGSTIHSTFAITTTAKLPYQPLGDERINSLRATMKDLQILILDEVSMVDHKILTYVHGRLRQIKQQGDYALFGNVSIMAVGDFFQLGPVKGTPLYHEQLVTDLWNNHFTHIELTKIMRQKNKEFAATLNRLRKHRKGDNLYQRDEVLLRQRETGEGELTQDLHIFPRNDEVAAHNIAMLHKTCTDLVQIKAQDTQRNPTTGQVTRKNNPKIDSQTCLSRTLIVGPSARVMLIKNIDLSDGLVNGVSGTVCKITFEGNVQFPKTILVNFDNDAIGRKLRSRSICFEPQFQQATPIDAVEDKVMTGGSRRQFPLRLAWACTIHKVQGLTLERAVVSLKKIFAAGQAYVALSRVTCEENLIIQDYAAKAFYSKPDIDISLQKMEPFIATPPAEITSTLKICLHNIQGLCQHMEDLKHDQRILSADIICVTETWLEQNTSVDSIEMPGWTFNHKLRSQSYHNMTQFQDLVNKQHGGVGYYHKDHITCNIIHMPCSDLEAIMFNVQPLNYNYIVLYKPPSYKLALFKQNLALVMQHFNQLSGGKVIMGDFNDNALVSKSAENFMQQQGYTQIVSSPTTENDTTIDHVYIRDINPTDIKVQILSTYYSDHECLCLDFLL
uniref:ATP-dependent DNA helicase n=1 Tax=Gadus morhua TaxID=8049 RepID=A0A8C4ZZC5_GADMO